MPRGKIIVYIPAEHIHPNPANPPARMEPAHTRSLVKSIRDDGLQYPILVSKVSEDHYQIIDGHRRFAVLQADHHEQIPCIIADGNSAHLYAMVNWTSRPLRGTDWAEIFVRGGQVPAGMTLNNLKRLSQLIGNEGIRDMAEAGVSPAVYQTARRVSRYCFDDDTDEEQLRHIVQWLISQRQSANCISIINNSQGRQLITEALAAGRRIKIA